MVQLYNQNIFFVQKDARGYSIFGLFGSFVSFVIQNTPFGLIFGLNINIALEEGSLFFVVRGVSDA